MQNFNQCENNLTCSILSLYSYISGIIDMHINRARACRSPFILLRGNLIQNLPQVLPTKFRFIWLSSYREKDFYKSTNQKKELPVVAMFVNGSELNQHFEQRTFQGCFLPSFDSFGQALAEMIFRNQPIRNKNCLQQSCLLTDRK